MVVVWTFASGPAVPAVPAAVENAMGACPPAALVCPAAVVCGEVAEPLRHWLALPRGRGPSQTPKFFSPGPPSPWLPALPPRGQTEAFSRVSAARVQSRGCKGRSPLHEITLDSPFPGGEGGWGG